MTSELTRRALFRDITLGAGATLLGPILGQLAAHAAGTPAAVRKRVVFCLQTNGMNPAHVCPDGWNLEKNGQPPANADTVEVSLLGKALHKALDPLAPFRDRLTLVRGLSGRVALGDHSCNHGALGAYPGNKGPLAQTVDSAVADALPGVFRHVAVGYAGGPDPMNYAYSASGPGTPVPIVTSPDLAYKSLFGSVAAGAARQQFDRRSDLLGFMADDVKRSRAALAGEEREKFDRYLRAFEALRDRQRELVAMEAELKKHAPTLGAKPTASEASLILEAQYDIAGAALVAGLTNVVTLTSGGGNQRFGKFPEFGILDLHGVGHGAAYGRASSEDCFVELRQFHGKLIAGLAKKLADTPEGDGTMLDNTLIVYLSDSGEAHHPRLHEWPVVLIGDLGGRLKKPGRFVQLPGYQKANGHRTMANLWCTLLHAVGKPRDQFGVPDAGLKDFDQTGPVPDLLA